MITMLIRQALDFLVVPEINWQVYLMVHQGTSSEDDPGVELG
jgi:hypothetical protein